MLNNKIIKKIKTYLSKLKKNFPIVLKSYNNKIKQNKKIKDIKPDLII